MISWNHIGGVVNGLTRCRHSSPVTATVSHILFLSDLENGLDIMHSCNTFSQKASHIFNSDIINLNNIWVNPVKGPQDFFYCNWARNQSRKLCSSVPQAQIQDPNRFLKIHVNLTVRPMARARPGEVEWG